MILYHLSVVSIVNKRNLFLNLQNIQHDMMDMMEDVSLVSKNDPI